MEISHEPPPALEEIRPQKRIDKERLEVCVYTSTCVLTGCIITGYVHRLPRQRILDLLNSVPVGGVRLYLDFLPLTEVTIHSSNGKEVITATALIHKNNILFVVEVGQSSVLAGEGAGRPTPLVGRSPVGVNLYLASYKLSGKLHKEKGQRLSDLLNIGDRFLPVTDVQIVDSSGNSQTASFAAINRAQIVYAEEISH